jgi:hypothetical protein
MNLLFFFGTNLKRNSIARETSTITSRSKNGPRGDEVLVVDNMGRGLWD